MAEPESTPARRAALLLHGLPAATQQQVLAKLDLAERSRLRPLLGELAELGLPPSLGRSLQHLESAPAPAEPMLDVPALSAQERVERLSADDVARCLQLCAPVTAAQLLRASAWPWQADVLARVPPALRAQVLAFMRGPSPVLAPQVLASLCEQLHRHATLVSIEPTQGHTRSTATHAARGRWPIISWVTAHVARVTPWMR